MASLQVRWAPASPLPPGRWAAPTGPCARRTGQAGAGAQGGPRGPQGGRSLLRVRGFSPRRLTPRVLVFQGLRFEVVPSRFKETLDKASFPAPYAYAMETAKQKALEVAARMYQVSGRGWEGGGLGAERWAGLTVLGSRVPVCGPDPLQRALEEPNRTTEHKGVTGPS